MFEVSAMLASIVVTTTRSAKCRCPDVSRGKRHLPPRPGNPPSVGPVQVDAPGVLLIQREGLSTAAIAVTAHQGRPADHHHDNRQRHEKRNDCNANAAVNPTPSREKFAGQFAGPDCHFRLFQSWKGPVCSLQWVSFFLQGCHCENGLGGIALRRPGHGGGPDPRPPDTPRLRRIIPLPLPLTGARTPAQASTTGSGETLGPPDIPDVPREVRPSLSSNPPYRP